MHRLIASWLSAILASLFAVLGVAGSDTNAPSPRIHDAVVLYQPLRVVPASTTTTTMPIPMTAKCPQWWQMARSAGWSEEELPTLDAVMWRESRCLTTAYNAGDPNGGSHGLLQVNGYWCKPSRWYPSGYLQDLRILRNCADLYQPMVNLVSALALFQYSAEANNGNGWRPWAVG